MVQRAICRATLSSRFKPFFDRYLTASAVNLVLPPVFSGKWVYGVDGKWLRRLGVFLVHRNVTTKQNLYWSFQPSESYQTLSNNLDKLAGLTVNHPPVGVISDWKGAIVSAVFGCWPEIPHQRCLTHVVRELKRLLPQKSPIEATRLLRGISLGLMAIDTENDLAGWENKLGVWYESYHFLLKERTLGVGTRRKWWYTHGNIRRAWRLLTADQQPLFCYLDNAHLPKSNNGLEGVISQTVGKLNTHRGMKLQQRVAFLNWYFAFTRVRNQQDIKKLWDYWKRP